eukprot:scaffold337_cov393-Prasinococcus_capsulatus_cf.AAC.3
MEKRADRNALPKISGACRCKVPTGPRAYHHKSPTGVHLKSKGKDYCAKEGHQNTAGTHARCGLIQVESFQESLPADEANHEHPKLPANSAAENGMEDLSNRRRRFGPQDEPKNCCSQKENTRRRRMGVHDRSRRDTRQNKASE